MSLKRGIVNFWNRIENLFLVNHACISCRREIPDETKYFLCKTCADCLDTITGNVCKICGEKILEDNDYCDLCKNVKFNFNQSRSYAVYSDVAMNVVKRFKYNSKKYYAKYIAEMMAENKKYFENVDYLTFVPIGAKRRKERGFNQAEEMAKHIGEILNIPVIDTLEKLGSERHQAGLTQKERRENLSGTITLKSCENLDLKDKAIMIIDDVFTTGSTLSECARVINSNKRNKPAKILCYTFAKTAYYSTNNGQNQQNILQTEEIKVN